MKYLMIIASMMILSSCSGIKSNDVDASIITRQINFCEVYEPILPSRHDTEETARYLMKYYNLWNDNCKIDEMNKF